jgi:RNA recognition motif-containing protein
VHLTDFIFVLLFHCPVCRNINIKGKYGFIEFDEAEDAEDAVKELDGKSFNGGRCDTRYPGFRIRIGSGFNRVSGYGSAIRNPDPNPGGPKLPTKVEKI